MRVVAVALLAVLVGTCVMQIPLAEPATAASEPLPPISTEASMWSDYGRYAEALLALQSVAGTDTALSMLDVMAQSDGRVAGVCHAIAHDLGHEAFAEAGGNAGRALASPCRPCVLPLKTASAGTAWVMVRCS